MTDDLFMATEDRMGELCRRAEELIGAVRGSVRRVRVQAGDLSVELEWNEPLAVAEQHVAVAGTAAAPVVTESALPDDAITVTAPLVGTFYRRPSPEARPFVEEGDLVEPGRQVAIIEAMKLMNPVEADRAGRVLEVLVKDGEPVEYGEPLFVLGPA